MDPSEQFLSQLPLIERILGHVCRRHYCASEEREEFASVARMKLIENDYAVLRRFKGQSQLSTYLTTVLQRAFLDWRNHTWGRWRPTAEARRRGPAAVIIERLVVRDGHSRSEAVEIARDRHGLPATQLAALAAELPLLPRPHVVTDEELAELPAPNSRPDHDLIESDRSRLREAATAAVCAALDQIPDEDRLLVQMRVLDGIGVADIARLLGLEARPLYRRLEAIYGFLRREVETRGIDATVVSELLNADAVEPGGVAAVPTEKRDFGPSTRQKGESPQ
jgi:RNA polymerase sigma factor for flagellar operon FliA